MAERRRAKTDTVTLRIDPKIKFMIDFLARVESKSMTAIVEDSIRAAADARSIGSYGNDDVNWSSFWDPHDGVRTLRLIGDSHYPTTAEEDDLRQFTLDHWPFFYSDKYGNEVKRWYVNVLWPNIEEILETWRTSSDRWAAGDQMRKLLTDAHVSPPRNWPPKELKHSDLDDDIPF